MLRGRAVSWLAVCSLAGGCDFIFRIDHVGDPAVTGDAGKPDALAPSCAAPILFDDFAGPDVCAPWGSPYQDNGASIAEPGALVMTPSQVQTSVAGCITNSDVAFGTGVMAVFDEAIGGPDVYTVLEVHNLEYQIKVGGDGKLHFQTATSTDVGTPITYQPAMRFWRIRPGPAGIIGEYSIDGVTWKMLGSANVAVPIMVGVELTGGTNAAGATGRAIVSQLLICPAAK